MSTTPKTQSATADLVAALAQLDNVKANKVVKANFTAKYVSLDALLDGFVTNANTVLQSPDPRAAAGAFHDSLAPFTRMLNRHLADEEDLILPVILKHRYG